jgi:NDP-sugar pyrophosphorylase family protein
VSLPPLALLAGGMATRLGELSRDKPKSLVDINGKPFIDHQLAWLRGQGVERVVVCTGHLGSQIQDHVRDGAAYGLSVDYSYDGATLVGTGGALKKALPKLGQAFFVLYGDSFLSVDFRALAESFDPATADAVMTVWKNEGELAPSNVEYAAGRVLAHAKKDFTPAMRHIDYGLSLVAAAPLAAEASESFDLSWFYGKLLRQGRLAGFEVPRRYYEAGSLEGLAALRAHLSGT